MTTPTTDEIREEAKSLFFYDNPTATTPEDDELKESGYWKQARDALMRSESAEYLSYLEQQAHDIGYRLVTEADHNKLIDLESKLDRIKTKAAKLKVLESQLDALKADLDREGKTKVVTVEKIVKEIKWRNRENRRSQVQAYQEEIVKKAKKKKYDPLEVRAAVENLSEINAEVENLENIFQLSTIRLDKVLKEASLL